MAIVRLVDCCDFLGGSQPPKEEWITSEKEGYVRMLQIRDFTQNRENQEEYVKYSNRLKFCKNDDILIARYGASVGKILTGFDGAYNVAIIKTIPNDKKLLKRYLYYYLNTTYFQKCIKGVGSRAAQAGFNKEDLKDMDIYLPEIETQQKIADVLDKAQELIEKRKEQIEKLDEFLKSVFLDMFGDIELNPKGWDIKDFEVLAKIDTKMINDFSDYLDLPHIGIENIEKNTGKLINYISVRDSGVTSGKYYFTSRHLIYSKIRPNLNKVAMPYFNGLCSADSYPILAIDGICKKEFLVYVLRSEYFLNIILSHSSRTNIPKVNKEQLKSFACYCPPFAIQDKFAAIVQKTEQQRELLEKSLTEMQNNFNSLMQKAFKGELFN